jgi:hypothetical protein
MNRSTANMILRIATAIVRRSTELRDSRAAHQLTLHPDARVFPNQLLVSDEAGRQYLLTITALRKPRLTLENPTRG